MIRIRSICCALMLVCLVLSCGDDPVVPPDVCPPCLRASNTGQSTCAQSNCKGLLFRCVYVQDGDKCLRVRDPNNQNMAQALIERNQPGARCPVHPGGGLSFEGELNELLRVSSDINEFNAFISAHGLIVENHEQADTFCQGIKESSRSSFLSLTHALFIRRPSNQQAARQAGCFADPTPGPQSTGVIDGNSIAENINAAAVMLGGPGAFDPARPRPVANRNTSSNSATAMTRPPNGVGGGSPQGSGPTSGSGTPPTGFSMPTPTLADGSSGGGSSNTTDSGLNASLPSDGKKTDDPAMEDSSEKLAAIDNASSFGADSQGGGRGSGSGGNPLSGMSDLLGSLTGKKGDGDQSNGSASNVNFGTRGPAAAPGATDPEVYLQRNSKLNLFEIIHERMQRF